MTVRLISLLTFEQFAWPHSENIFLSIFPGDGEALQLFSSGRNWSLLHANLRHIFVLSNNNRDSLYVPCLHSYYSWTELNCNLKYL